MDSLQQQFGGELDIINKKPKWVSFITFCVGGAIITAVFGYFWWPKPAPTPIAEEVVEQPLSESEVETYRAALPKTVTIDGTTQQLQISTQKTSVRLIEDESAVSVVEPVSAFVPPTAATPVSITTVGDSAPGMQATEVGVPNTIYTEGDITVDGVVISQPDVTNLKPVEATVIVVDVDASTNQIVVTSNGELLTLKMVDGRLQTKDGKLVAITSIATNDILAITGDLLADTPVVQVRTASFIGVQEIIDVVEE